MSVVGLDSMHTPAQEQRKLDAMAISFPLALMACALSDPPPDEFGGVVVPFIERFCSECHARPSEDVDLVLTQARAGHQARADRLTWEDVAAVVDLHEMPPRDSPQPDRAERERVIQAIERVLAEGEESCAPIVRRLNAEQYSRTVRDVFGVEFDAAGFFPPDGIGFGFDTVAASLTLSDLSVEKYLQAAESIAALAVPLDLSANPPRVRHLADKLSGNQRGKYRYLSTNGTIKTTFTIPRSGRYRLQAAAAATQAGDELARMALVLKGKRLAEFEVAALRGQPSEVHGIECELEAGQRTVGAAFVNDFFDPQHPDPARRDRNLGVEWIELVGPMDAPPPSGFQVAMAAVRDQHGADSGEHAVLAHLIERLWRRPAGELEVQRLVGWGLGECGSDEQSANRRLRLWVTALLASPRFILRTEPDPDGLETGALRRLNGHELASRLSFFLWGCAPSPALLAAANAGELDDEIGYLSWAERLLDDLRSQALSESFTLQWLQLRALEERAEEFEPSPGLLPAMLGESVDFFDAVLREKRSVWELLEADWTVANPLLAELYGLPVPAEPGAQRLSLGGTERRGVLGQAAVLTLTSEAQRTSPVRRGKWVLEALLGVAQSGAPALPNALAEPETGEALSLRELWEKHRLDPACAVCHDAMDPIGFGLENYGPRGGWRMEYDQAMGPTTVDASGKMPDGTEFTGPLDLVQSLRSDGRFIEALVDKLGTYALGRPLTLAESEMLTATEPALGELSLRAVILRIACSEPFTHVRVGGGQ